MRLAPAEHTYASVSADDKKLVGPRITCLVVCPEEKPRPRRFLLEPPAGKDPPNAALRAIWLFPIVYELALIQNAEANTVECDIDRACRVPLKKQRDVQGSAVVGDIYDLGHALGQAGNVDVGRGEHCSEP